MTPRVFPRTPLDGWIAARIGVARLDHAALEDWQLARLNETLALARTTPFHGRHLAEVPHALERLEDLALLPCTTAQDLRHHGPDMLAVPPGEVQRMVTLPTSGTSGPAKRLGFTAADLELTADFFRHGMATFTRPGQRVLVLMPGDRPGSVGERLAEGLARMGVGRLRVADGDVFEEHNLNRQLLSSPAWLGRPKAEAAAELGELRALGEDGIEVGARDDERRAGGEDAEERRAVPAALLGDDDRPGRGVSELEAVARGVLAGAPAEGAA